MADDLTNPAPTPEGSLIRAALARSGLSAHEAARMAGVSEGRWRQIVSGYQTPAKGVRVAVRGPADTVAAMAQAVGVTPDQLKEAGREDAAGELPALLKATPQSAMAPPSWEGDLVGPTSLLHEGEGLRWRTHGDGRLYELTAEGVTFEVTLEPQRLSEAVPLLRRLLVKRMARVTMVLVDRI